METYHTESKNIQGGRKRKVNLYHTLCTEMSYRLINCCASKHCDTSSPPALALLHSPLSSGPGENKSIPWHPISRKLVRKAPQNSLCRLISPYLLGSVRAGGLHAH